MIDFTNTFLLLLLYCGFSRCSSAAISSSSKIDTDASAPISNPEPQCEYKNFGDIIENGKFSLLVMTPECNIFYIDNEKLSNTFNLSELVFNSAIIDCQGYFAKFVKIDNQYKVLVGSLGEKMMEIVNGTWTKRDEPGVFQMVYNEINPHDVCPTGSRCRMTELFTNVDANYAYVITKIRGRRTYSQYALPDMDITHNQAIVSFEETKTRSNYVYDSDMKFLYFYDDEDHWSKTTVNEDNATGKIDLSTGTESKIKVDKEYKILSVSHGYYLAKKVGRRGISFHVGPGAEERCVLSTKEDHHWSMELFVGDPKGYSAYESIREQISSPPSTTTAAVSTDGSAPHTKGTSAASSLLLTLLFSYVHAFQFLT